MPKLKDKRNKISTTFARSEDGTIQITFIIPYSEIKKRREETLKELSREVEIPGFRKGFAPISKIEQTLSENTILEKILSKLLPNLINHALKKYKIRPSIYPRFELTKARKDEDWEIKAITCEIPEVELGNYKKALLDVLKVRKIWTPGTSKPASENQTEDLTKEEKEQMVIKTLLDSVKVKIPKILIEEEANSRLSRLLSRLEKIGLSLESYLSSSQKTPQQLRQEYEKQAHDAIALDLILTKVAQEQNINVDPKEIEAAINAAGADPKLAKELENEDRKRFLETILRRRKALDYLTSLA